MAKVLQIVLLFHHRQEELTLEANIIANLIVVSTETPKGPDYDDGSSVYANFGRWARQNASFSGGASPRDQTFSEQQVQNRTSTFVITIPMAMPQEGGPTTPETPESPESIEQGLSEEEAVEFPVEELTIVIEELQLPAEESEAEVNLNNQPVLSYLENEIQINEQAAGPTIALEQAEQPALESELQGEGPVLENILQETTPALESSIATGNAPVIPESAVQEAQGIGESVQGPSQGEAKGITTETQAGQESQFPPAQDLIWFSALSHGGQYNLSFWQAYFDYGRYPDGGYNFGYEEIIDNCPTGAAIGMDIYSAFYYPDFGATSSNSILHIGPGSYSAPSNELGIIPIDLTKNNQAAIPTSLLPDEYEPRRDGLGPVLFPTEQHPGPDGSLVGGSIACVCVVTSLAINGPNIITPPNWMRIGNFMQGTILSSLYIGKIAAGVTKISIILPSGTGPTVGCAALMAMPQARYSVPYQICITKKGKVTTPFTDKSIKLGIAPSVPANYPATSDTGYVVYADPFKIVPHIVPAIDMGVGKKNKPVFKASIDTWRENLKNCCG